MIEKCKIINCGLEAMENSYWCEAHQEDKDLNTEESDK